MLLATARCPINTTSGTFKSENYIIKINNKKITMQQYILLKLCFDSFFFFVICMVFPNISTNFEKYHDPKTKYMLKLLNKLSKI